MGLPKCIEVIREGATCRLLIDGEDVLGGWIERNTLSVRVDPDEAPTVTVTLLAERVEVRNSLDAEG